MKKFSMILLITLAITTLTGCKIDSISNGYTTHIYVDKNTGVNYVWISSTNGIAMQPRYNADGSLFVTKQR